MTLGLSAALAPRRVAGQQPDSVPPVQLVTLDEAIRVARNANARLPVASLNVDLARQQLREAAGRLFPRIAVDGDLHLGVPQTYATNDARLQLVAVDTLFGAGRRAARALSRSILVAAGAGYQVAVRDVELAVRLRFTEYDQARAEIAFRQAGIALLRRYLTTIESLRAAGQGVTSDVLQTQVRLETEQADVMAAQARLNDARMQLNELMGRVPDAPLVLAPLAPPVPPPVLDSAAWARTPDVDQAAAVAAAARAAVGITRAERLPRITLNGNIGTEPVLGSSSAPAPLNPGRGSGGELTLGFTLPIWDAGVYRARLAQAQILARQAGGSAAVVMRESRLAWQRAAAELDRLYDEVQTRSRAITAARDAYLVAESEYRGGAGLSVDVLNAYTLWVIANQSHTDAVLRYRQAEAQLIRWGTP